MAAVELRGLSHSYASEPGGGAGFAIRDLNILWRDGTANALLGPSGCGKTTLLNILSGLLPPTGGAVLLDGEEVTSWTPGERQVAQVFQFPVVYETMTVFDNLAFPLRNRGVEESAVRTRVGEIAKVLELDGLLNAGAGRLNPAEKQLISLGRGIVRKDTSAVLLDEPLTVIDPVQKPDLRRRLRQVQRELRMTMIYVTHDQHEALTFADEVTVMNAGAVVQSATPEELFLHPATPFVGHFIGSPGMNLMTCAVDGERLRLDGEVAPAGEAEALLARLRSLRGDLRLGIRPEFIEVEAEGGAKDGGMYELSEVDYLGAYQVWTMRRGGLRVKALVNERVEGRVGMPVAVRFPADKVRIYEDGRLVEAMTEAGS